MGLNSGIKTPLVSLSFLRLFNCRCFSFFPSVLNSSQLDNLGNHQHNKPGNGWHNPAIEEVDAASVEDILHKRNVEHRCLQDKQNPNNDERHLIFKKVFGNNWVGISNVEQVENLSEDNDVNRHGTSKNCGQDTRINKSVKGEDSKCCDQDGDVRDFKDIHLT